MLNRLVERRLVVTDRFSAGGADMVAKLVVDCSGREYAPRVQSSVEYQGP